MVILFFLFFLVFTQPVFATPDTPISDPTTTTTSTPSPSPSLTPTTIPTPDLTIINPESGISLSEFMPYFSLEWIEIYNDNDKPVELKNWTIKDNSSNTKTIPDLKILSKSYAIFEFSNFLNKDTDKIMLVNHSNQVVGQYDYPTGKFTLEKRSWSLVSGSWCQAEMTKNSSNASSCYSTPTPTPKPTVTPTALPTDKNLYQLDESATASAIFTPIEESGFYTTPTIFATPFASNLVLGQTTTAKKNYLPLIFIVSGGLLLMSPLLIDKFKKK